MAAKFRYVPILRWKRGEQTGLANLTADSKIGVAPLFMFAAEQHKDKKATKKTAEVVADQVFCNQVKATWGAGQFFVDASGLADAARHPLASIATLASATGLHLVPATRLGYANPYQSAVAALARKPGVGMALRIDLNEMADASAWHKTLPVAPSLVDLIVDLRDGGKTLLGLGPAAHAAFAALPMGADWRSVTLCGTSIPEMFTGVAPGLHFIPRSELLFWRALTAGPLSYRLDFGDYCTVSAVGPPTDVPPGFPINVKYTLDNDFLVCKGVKTSGKSAVPMATQFIGHAKGIAFHARRGALPGSWSDVFIDDVAAGKIQPSGTERWVSTSIHRHIALTRARLP